MLLEVAEMRGFLTHQEIYDLLPTHLANEESLDGIISLINEIGVTVCETSPASGDFLSTTGSPTPPETEGCMVSFSFVCNKEWEDLELIDEARIRHCVQCSRLVHLCYSDAEAVEAAKLGRCITLITKRSETTP